MVRLYKYKEVAEILGLAEQTIRKWVHQGKIPVVKLGSSARVTQETVNKLAEEGLNADTHA